MTPSCWPLHCPTTSDSRGLFISFEGPEGAGKTTQIDQLAQRLRMAKHEVCTTREPGGTPLGEQLRALLLDPATSNRDPVIEVLLMMASRRDHIQEVIRPQLAAGVVVITDRYTDSTYAYQGCGSGIEHQWISLIMERVTGGLLPSLTILLDLDPATGLTRKYHALGDKEAISSFEGRGLAYHRRVREGFLDLARLSPERWLTLDATRPVEWVSNHIWDRINQLVNSTSNLDQALRPQEPPGRRNK